MPESDHSPYPLSTIEPLPYERLLAHAAQDIADILVSLPEGTEITITKPYRSKSGTEPVFILTYANDDA